MVVGRSVCECVCVDGGVILYCHFIVFCLPLVGGTTVESSDGGVAHPNYVATRSVSVAVKPPIGTLLWSNQLILN